MSEQPNQPSEGDEKFEQKVEQRLTDKREAGPDEDPTDVPQEHEKSDLPVLEEDEESVATPGSSDA